MPTYTIEDDMYHKYDIIVSEILTEIINTSSKEGVIRLMDFNRKDKNHLLVLRIALMARDLYQLPIEIDCGWWDRFILNLKIRKNFNKIKKTPNSIINGIWVPHILDLIKIKNDFVFDFSDIYNAYYEGSCN